MAEDLAKTPIDAVLFLDRLDLYRVEPLDRAMMRAVTDTFGRGLWGKAVLGLTHGNLAQPPPGTTYGEPRARALRLHWFILFGSVLPWTPWAL